MSDEEVIEKEFEKPSESNNQMDEVDFIIEAFEKDQQQAEKFIKGYETRVAPPEKPTEKELSFWNLVGIKATLFAASAFGGIIFSSIRTGGYFYIVENTLLSKYGISPSVVSVLSAAAFISTLFAFEGYALADGFSEGELLKEAKKSRIGFWASFLTIALVGIFSGLEIVELNDGVKHFMSLITAVLTSLSAATIAFFGGQNLGFAVEQYRYKKKKMIDDYNQSYADWRERAYASYTSTMGSAKKRLNIMDVGDNIDESQITPEPMKEEIPRRHKIGSLGWRKAMKKLNMEDKLFILNHTVEEVAEEFDLIDKTAENWKDYCERDFGHEFTKDFGESIPSE